MDDATIYLKFIFNRNIIPYLRSFEGHPFFIQPRNGDMSLNKPKALIQGTMPPPRDSNKKRVNVLDEPLCMYPSSLERFITSPVMSSRLTSSERSDECFDFTMIITSRNNASISNFGGSFRWKMSVKKIWMTKKTRKFNTRFLQIFTKSVRNAKICKYLKIVPINVSKILGVPKSKFEQPHRIS
ncbi:hypothetical protein AGLY_006964 [Aphis glycines]|uniref:Uncharacterized protein n=1 Tax=Aphis glycines TaxID=307491 RepID=A0A6G0TS09_APHGL|nr:hypothetical protein AGLY_006964 [Aphis glycines]